MARWYVKSESNAEKVWQDLDNPADVRVEYLTPDLPSPAAPPPTPGSMPLVVTLSHASYRAVVLVSAAAGACTALLVELGLHIL